MERLTEYQKAQKWLEGFDWDNEPESCDNLATICEALQEIEKIKAKQEQGLLMKLPVAIGEVAIGEEVYCILGREISKNRVISYQTPPPNVDGVIAKGYMGMLLGVVGKNVFTTRSEAEEALAKMGGK